MNTAKPGEKSKGEMEETTELIANGKIGNFSHLAKRLAK